MANFFASGEYNRHRCRRQGSDTMKNTMLLQAALAMILCAGSAFAQDATNAPRRIEISYTGMIGPGFVRKGGWNLGGACVQVAVRATDSAAVVGEFCGTHQFRPTRARQGEAGRPNLAWPQSEPAANEQVPTLYSFRGGVRLSQRAGARTTTFAQGLVGVETNYRHGGLAGNTGFSLAAGGGVDVHATDWFAYEIARANVQTTRVGGTTANSLRFGTGPVFRFGEIQP
jgi:hypothetical protein